MSLKVSIQNYFIYAILSVLLMLSVLVISNNYSNLIYVLIYASIFGFLFGLVQDIFQLRNLRHLPFIFKILFKAVVISLINVIVLIIIYLIVRLTTDLDKNIIEFLFNTLSYKHFISIFIFSIILSMVGEISNYLGSYFYYDLIFNKYKKPVLENRIFVFYDLINSVSIAQKIGNENFFEFLDDCFFLLQKEIKAHNGEVVKYLGDEVIITWKSKKANFNQALDFYFDSFEIFKQKEDFFMKKYGVVPNFKMGAHSGSVITAYLGYLKKNKDYNGEGINTAARVVSQNSKLDTLILISEDFKSELSENHFKFKKFENQNLKGLNNTINLFSVQKK